MTADANNPWVNLWLDQMWLGARITDTASKCVDADLLLDPQALTEHCLEPNEPRLNPLDFHGKQRSAPRRTSPSRALERTPQASRNVARPVRRSVS